ncbi:MAG: DUF2163 domain-containing protein [Alphaproteobacteria bacterium]
MKQISAGLQSHMEGEVTTLATCWKVTRRDNTVLGFTNHDRDITYNSHIYTAATGFTPTAIDNSTALNVDNLDAEGMLSSGSITEADIMAGRYDYAEIEIFQLNYENLSQGALQLRRGWLGEVSFHRDYFVAEVRGLTQILAQSIGELYSASCRAALGDARCKVTLASHTVTGSVTGAVSKLEFIDSSRSEVSGIYDFGALTFTSGSNSGVSVEVKEYYLESGGGRIILALPMPQDISISDTYSLTKGCDKTISTCFNRFNNVANFRGEPNVPGIDRMLETAGTRTNR